MFVVSSDVLLIQRLPSHNASFGTCVVSAPAWLRTLLWAGERISYRWEGWVIWGSDQMRLRLVRERKCRSGIWGGGYMVGGYGWVGEVSIQHSYRLLRRTSNQPNRIHTHTHTIELWNRVQYQCHPITQRHINKNKISHLLAPVTYLNSAPSQSQSKSFVYIEGKEARSNERRRRRSVEKGKGKGVDSVHVEEVEEELDGGPICREAEIEGWRLGRRG
ncbi:hypothetical protein B0J11DRAFT_19954 [Dendryphion nanum]|uniref:Uncharacterized protein n=1 Tax=Dendryphion nanum TaxID=256645 RepID=A0A9P9J235_9PLEO|nr:hypothetical protein B0J11DRAFT_19954 [Dendryphion nanum]